MRQRIIKKAAALALITSKEVWVLETPVNYVSFFLYLCVIDVGSYLICFCFSTNASFVFYNGTVVLLTYKNPLKKVSLLRFDAKIYGHDETQKILLVFYVNNI